MKTLRSLGIIVAIALVAIGVAVLPSGEDAPRARPGISVGAAADGAASGSESMGVSDGSVPLPSAKASEQSAGGVHSDAGVGSMDALDILRDLASRPRAAADALREHLNPVSLNARPGGHDNSVAWLLWHTGREIDVQLADLTRDEQLWTSHGYADRFALGPLGDTVGYGHTPDEARRIVIEDGRGLLEYVDAALAAIDAHLAMVTVEDLEDVIDEQWDPPITRGARLVSILDDAIQHLAQAAYALGMLENCIE